MASHRAPPRFLTRLEEKLHAEHTAVLVIDVQNDFCAEDGYITQNLGLDTAPCRTVTGPIMALVEGARNAGTPVIWVRAIYNREYLQEPVLAKQSEMGIAVECCMRGSWGAEFFNVTPTEDEPIYDKHRYSAFSNPQLDEALKKRGIRSLILAGVQTNVCIDSTLRDAFSQGYYIVVPEDCVASHTPELHRATLKNVAVLFGTVTTSADILGCWKSTRPAKA